MKNALMATIIGVCALGLMTGCTELGSIVGTGPIVNRTYDFSDFNGVEVSNAFEFEISQANTYGISVSTYQNVVDNLEITKSGTSLIVRLKEGRFTTPSPRVTVTMPDLQKLTVSGASKGSVRDFKSNNVLNVKVSGASQVNMNVESGSIKLDISGSSKLTGNLKSTDTRLTVTGASRVDLNGTCGNTDIEVSGASQLNSANLAMQDTNVNISGASSATINAKGTLNVDASGASTLNYLGNPVLKKVNINGSSKVNSR
jgi:hypothetical protein